MIVDWNRTSMAITYKTDKTYDIKEHPGNSAQDMNSSALSDVALYSAVTFGKEKPSESFKAQLKKAFEDEQKQHDPMEHVDATHISNMKLADVKIKFEQFLRKLYPNGKFETVTIKGKSYQVVAVVRSASSVVTTTNYVNYAFKERFDGQTEIQMHNSNWIWN